MGGLVFRAEGGEADADAGQGAADGRASPVPMSLPCSMTLPMASSIPPSASPNGPSTPVLLSVPSIPENASWAALEAADAAVEPAVFMDVARSETSPMMRTMTDGPATLPARHLAAAGRVVAFDGGGLCAHQPDHGREHLIVDAVYVAGEAAPVAAESGDGVAPLPVVGSASMTSHSTS